MKRSQSGYSLVEVLIAMAITSVVLLTVVTLFYMGRRNVYSGKQMTYAVSVGTRMLEDLSSMSQADVLSNFGINDATTRSNVVLSATTLPNGALTIGGSTSRDTSTCTGSGTPVVWTCTNDPQGYLAAWKGLIDPTKLTNAQVGLVLTPRAATDNARPWTTATYVKVRAYVKWEEAKNRQRVALFDTTKVYRQ